MVADLSLLARQFSDGERGPYIKIMQLILSRSWLARLSCVYKIILKVMRHSPVRGVGEYGGEGSAKLALFVLFRRSMLF